MKWEKVLIKDICKSVTSGGTPLSKINEYYFPKEIPWVNTGEVNYQRIYDTNKYISQDGLKNSSAKLLPINTVIVAMYGQGDTAGRVAINKIPVATNQACCNLIIDENVADYRYVYYRFFMLYSELVALKTGGAQPNLNMEKVKNVQIPLPPLPIQRRIADILSAYDDLIENNRKQIKLLEEAAQRLYKEWFVDLRFPGHEKVKVTDGVPEGWERKPISGIAPIVTGKKDANYGTENGKYLFFTCSQEPLKADGYSFDGDAVILAGNGDFSVRLYRGKFEAYQRTYVLIPNEKKMLYLLYFAIKQELAQLFQGASGSTIKFLTKGMIEKILLFVPSKNILDLFNDNLENLQTKMEKANQQICLAQEARDRLLPKLMSGEIEV